MAEDLERFFFKTGSGVGVEPKDCDVPGRVV